MALFQWEKTNLRILETVRKKVKTLFYMGICAHEFFLW
jgi:hypothetical protein